MSEQDGKQATTIHRPPTNNPEAWKAYWEKQGQPWRTEPEIDTKRQKYLDERRAIVPDIKQGVYPFKDVKLDRADVEWLLATHENGRGPVNWNDEKQRERKGLDLRGADLRYADLQKLPLARLCGALTWREAPDLTKEQRSRYVMTTTTMDHGDPEFVRWMNDQGLMRQQGEETMQVVLP